MKTYQYGTDILPEYDGEKLKTTVEKIIKWSLKSLGIEHLVSFEVYTNLDQQDRTRDSLFIRLIPHGEKNDHQTG